MNLHSERGRAVAGARLAGVLALACLGLVPTSAATAAPIRILALGDSITNGLSSPASTPGGYRGRLFRNLTEAGYSPQFVGNSIDNPDLTLPPESSPHDGHSGFLIDGQGGYSTFAANTYIGKWLAPGNGVDPDYVLLMLGANHILGQYQAPAAPYELAALITRISGLRPDAKILVSTLTPQATAANQAQVEQFNATLGGPSGLVAQLRNLGQDVTLVDVGSSLTAADLSDLVHPSKEGYDKLGDAWFRAIQSSNLTPVPTPEPSTFAVLGLGFAGLAATARARSRGARRG